ncbi:hypothetical protein GCM10010393_15410 [Streptomyces gobitricini]|uniref:Uncharacterized protein n=1 Tax=Streptomyces gobitricini TaxID=68211 RepID=A0ABN3LJA6_9ACTN
MLTGSNQAFCGRGHPRLQPDTRPAVWNASGPAPGPSSGDLRSKRSSPRKPPEAGRRRLVGVIRPKGTAYGGPADRRRAQCPGRLERHPALHPHDQLSISDQAVGRMGGLVHEFRETAMQEAATAELHQQRADICRREKTIAR